MEMATSRTTFPSVRACIFDLDGTLINSEDIYIEIYNNILHEYGKPDLPWSVNARMQSTGRKVSSLFGRSYSMNSLRREAKVKIRVIFSCSHGLDYL